MRLHKWKDRDFVKLLFPDTHLFFLSPTLSNHVLRKPQECFTELKSGGEAARRWMTAKALTAFPVYSC